MEIITLIVLPFLAVAGILTIDTKQTLIKLRDTEEIAGSGSNE
ncbi:hypothetical protein ACLIBH_04940 [Virgibacillus sp. W0430]